MLSQALVIALSAMTLVIASPIIPKDELVARAGGPYDPVHGGKTSGQVTAAQISDFMLYSQYAAAAYCASNNNGNNKPVTCSTGNCPLVEQANVNGIYEFENSFFTDVTGYVGVSDSAKTIVLAFRGTKSLANALTDAAIIKSPYPNCAGCKVHTGFYFSWNEKRTDILAPLKQASASHPDYKIVVTGHSLGGAIAVFAAADIRAQGYAAALYTYGQPRVGNDQFDAYIEATAGPGNFRITHTNDPVPQVPPLQLQYNHYSPEYWVNTDNVTPGPSDISICKGRSNIDCNAGTGGFNLAAHGLYFGPIGKCAPAKDPSI